MDGCFPRGPDREIHRKLNVARDAHRLKVTRFFVMAGHSHLKNGVAFARLCPAIHVFLDLPNYHEMSPALAEATRHQLPNLQSGREGLGAIRCVKFLGVGRQGEDVYTVRHENGASHWRIALDSKGTISTAWLSPGP
jgi:hypothetical protein